MKIKTRYKRLSEKISKLNQEIETLREECTHPDVHKEYKSDTGNYDPSVDSYWIKYNCPDCGKFWTTPQ